jgi:hypothetical protein
MDTCEWSWDLFVDTYDLQLWKISGSCDWLYMNGTKIPVIGSLETALFMFTSDWPICMVSGSLWLPNVNHFDCLNIKGTWTPTWRAQYDRYIDLLSPGKPLLFVWNHFSHSKLNRDISMRNLIKHPVLMHFSQQWASTIKVNKQLTTDEVWFKH